MIGKLKFTGRQVNLRADSFIFNNENKINDINVIEYNSELTCL